MGSRISYFRNNDGKTLKVLLVEHYAQFRVWYLEQQERSKAEFNEEFGSEYVKNYMYKNTIMPTDLSGISDRLIDELASEFVANYLDSNFDSIALLETVGPCVNKARYGEATKLLVAMKDEEVVRLWSYIVNGRSIKDGGTFDSYSNDNRVGYLSSEEIGMLKTKIEQYYPASNSVLRNEGFELVLDAISNIDSRHNELVVTIDMP
jgi:hypothetical protein